MLWQLHFQYKDGHTEMIAQEDFPLADAFLVQAAFQKWALDIAAKHALPEGAIWMWCNEDSEHFVRTDY
jgi:hypothetical protein